MGGRSRIRWHKVAKLALAGFGCLALFMGLPSLLRRPEPPPLEPDIGLAHVAAPREPATPGLRPKAPRRRHAAKPTARDRQRANDRRPRGSRRPDHREQAPPSTSSPASGASAPAQAQALTPTTAAAPPPAPPPPIPPAAGAQASQSAAESEFGFER